MAEFRWSASATDYLIELADCDRADVAERIVGETLRRLEQPPRSHRRLRIRRPGGRRLYDVQVMLLHRRRLPFLVYYRYVAADDVVEIVTIRHGRQRPISPK